MKLLKMNNMKRNNTLNSLSYSNRSSESTVLTEIGEIPIFIDKRYFYAV